MDYARTVKAIGNEKDLTKVDLRSILPSATVMVVTVTATTSNGKELSPEEWKVTEEACDVAFELDNAKRTVGLFGFSFSLSLKRLMLMFSF